MESQFRYTEQIRKWNEEHINSTGNARTACVRTFGCQMNEHDSEKIAGMLARMGFDIVSDYSAEDPVYIPDVIVYNTCCIRENAEEKVYGHLGALKDVKRRKPDMIICVVGCMTEQEGSVAVITSKYRNVDIIAGTRDTYRLPEYLCGKIFDGRSVKAGDGRDTVPEGVPILREHSYKAWVTVMYGCNNFCSYCIVPYVRGRERSRRASDIINEVRELAANGTVEITLLGQNVNSYGHDIKDDDNDGCSDFAELLQRIEKETDIKRIRFMTSHPKDLSDKLISVMAQSRVICRQLHLPVQSGSSEILRKMNRRYSREDYLLLVDKVRNAMPDITLSTDIIVGFPGETEADFEETLSLVERVRYDSAYTFLYSQRTGTAAAVMENQVDEATAKKRFDRLLHLQNTISRECNVSLIGSELEVLCEGYSRTDKTRMTGRTSGNKIVNFGGATAECEGRLVRVRIDGAQTWSLEGAYVEG